MMSVQKGRRHLFLLGLPNAGKTSLFNILVHAQAQVGNYPGVTVEKREGQIVWEQSLLSQEASFWVVDLPGIYGFDPHSLDEKTALEAWGQRTEEDLGLVVVDGTQLQRSLPLVLGLRKQARGRILLLLNRWEGEDCSMILLSQKLGMPALCLDSDWSEKELRRQVLQSLETLLKQNPADATPEEKNSGERPQVSSLEELRLRCIEADQLFKQLLDSQANLRQARKEEWTDALDRVFLHPVWGSLLLGLILILFFQLIFVGTEPIKAFLESQIDVLGTWIQAQTSLPPLLKSLLVHGILGGVGSIFVFVPQILVLFLFLFLLEDSGYFARAALLMDRWMGRVGLHGKAFLPLLSSFACAVPGILSTRTIQNSQDRLITILIAPLMTCSARLPIYTLIIGAFVPPISFLGGWIHLRGLVLFGLYFLGIFFAGVMAKFFRKMLSPSSGLSANQGSASFSLSSPFLMELPHYQWPQWKSMGQRLLEKLLSFVKRVGSLIFIFTILIWFLASYPQPPIGWDGAFSPDKPISFSLIGQGGKILEPFFRPLGFSWEITVSLLSSFLARELIIGSLATVYSLESPLGVHLVQHWSLATALSVLVWYVFSMQCLSTLAVVRRETHSWKWPLVMLAYMTVLAYAGSWFTYRVVSFWVEKR